MNYQEIAKLIPASYRKEILETNMIANAVGIGGNPEMFYLHSVWKQFIEPEIGDCALCFQRVLTNFRQLQQTFIDLKQADELLQTL